MTDIGWETIYFFLGWVGISAAFTAIWALLHVTGILRREDSEWVPGDQPEDWWK